MSRTYNASAAAALKETPERSGSGKSRADRRRRFITSSSSVENYKEGVGPSAAAIRGRRRCQKMKGTRSEAMTQDGTSSIIVLAHGSELNSVQSSLEEWKEAETATILRASGKTDFPNEWKFYL